MRLRYVTGSRELIASHPDIVHNPEQHKGNWSKVFGNDNPICIEIGMGKGKFITTLAEQNPDINYIGIEKFEAVILRAIEKQEELKLPNLRLLCVDAKILPDIFDIEEIDTIFLNFSDPWPKDRHSKRRLTSHIFLELYEQFLKKDGHIRFKTDNVALFDFSLEEAAAFGWEILKMSRDLHNSEWNEGNVMTEYEEKFSAEGNCINFMEITKKIKSE